MALVGSIARYEIGDVACEVGPFEMSEGERRGDRTVFTITVKTRWLKYVDGEWHEITARELRDHIAAKALGPDK